MTGPSRQATETVDRRDDWSCARCGKSLLGRPASRHHRQSRRGGNHEPSNLLLLCGSGTTGCHGWAHRHPEKAYAEGWSVRTNSSALPWMVPVFYHRAEWVLLGDAGGVKRIPESEAIELLVMLGQRKPVGV